jgi:hypothetical protein
MPANKKKSPGFPTLKATEKKAAVGHIKDALDHAEEAHGGDAKKAIAAGLHKAAPDKHSLWASRSLKKPVNSGP